MNVVIDVFQQIMLMLPMILGIFISYRLLRITELSVEASFVFGACIFAKLVQSGISIPVSAIAGMGGGAIVGLVVPIAHKKLSLPVLISGILMIFMFQSINFLVMGRPNIQIIRIANDVNIFSSYFVINSIIILLLILFLKSMLGVKLRAVGINMELSIRAGVPANMFYILAIITSNTLASLSGIMHAYYGGFSDIYMGVGISLVGIASLMIGISIFKVDKTAVFHLGKEVISILLGVAAYSLIISLLLYLGCDPIYLKFMLGVVVFVAIYSSNNNSGEQYAVIR